MKYLTPVRLLQHNEIATFWQRDQLFVARVHPPTLQNSDAQNKFNTKIEAHLKKSMFDSQKSELLIRNKTFLHYLLHYVPVCMLCTPSFSQDLGAGSLYGVVSSVQLSPVLFAHSLYCCCNIQFVTTL